MWRRIFILGLLALLPAQALADGKVFRQRAIAVETTIPDQRALICWSNGLERLVIETRFSGEGTNFAWVVPLPSVPEIELATSGAFTTLAFQLRPALIHDPDPWCSLFLAIIGIGWIVRSSSKSREFGFQQFLACFLVGLSWLPFSPAAVPFVVMFMIWATARVLRGTGSLLDALVVLALILLLASLLLPSLGSATAGFKNSSTTDLSELASARVGAFETKTISARTSTALLDWLRENEFMISTNAEPVIADYIKQGWVFVASKLARENGAVATNSIHPLSFTFRTQQPVYPMRLTGVDAVPLQVELYVFGPARAGADHFSVATCVSASFPQESGWKSKLSDSISVMHPLLREWTLNSPVVTKLSARLSPDQMREDVVLRWSGFKPHRDSIYSRQAALTIAANWATGFLLGAYVLVLAGFTMTGGWSVPFPKIAFGLAGVALAGMGVVYATLPKVSVTMVRSHPAFVRHYLKELAAFTILEWQDSPPKSIEEARRAVVFQGSMKTNNLLLGGGIREEDSPGNYVIRQTTNGFEFLWFDGNGAEQTLR